MSSPRGSSKGSPKVSNPGQSAAPKAAGNFATGTHTGSGSKVCKKFNDTRGCHKPCQDGHTHVCDLVLAKTGKICGRGDHSRRTHDAARHGAPADRV
jgi:hypothetical protein